MAYRGAASSQSNIRARARPRVQSFLYFFHGDSHASLPALSARARAHFLSRRLAIPLTFAPLAIAQLALQPPLALISRLSPAGRGGAAVNAAYFSASYDAPHVSKKLLARTRGNEELRASCKGARARALYDVYEERFSIRKGKKSEGTGRKTKKKSIASAPKTLIRKY